MHCEAVTMAASEERKMWHLMDSPLAGFSYQNKSRTITVDGVLFKNNFLDSLLPLVIVFTSNIIACIQKINAPFHLSKELNVVYLCLYNS